MRIVADQAIPFVAEAFAGLGEVSLYPGRSIDRRVVADADVLIVRTITRVSADLLDGAKVRFVGTATIGTDHVDTEYLAGAGIRFASAAGCNANSVGEYVVAALLHAAEKTGVLLKDQTIGVVGVGNVGSKVAAKCRALGMNVLLNDPPRQRAEGGNQWFTLEKILWESDVVTLHTPLTRTGPDPTWHLLGHERLARMKPGALLINTARGPVVDNAALTDALSAERHLGGAVLDVWEHEPKVLVELLDRAMIATPHIAGYSLDGKATATRMMYEAVCRFAGAAPSWRPSLPPAPVPVIQYSANRHTTDQAALESLVRGVYDITADDARLRGLRDLPEEQRAAYFDGLRKNYPVRREFRFTEIRGQDIPASLRETLERLEFRTTAQRSE